MSNINTILIGIIIIMAIVLFNKNNENMKVLVPNVRKKKNKIISGKKYCDFNEMENLDTRLMRDVVIGKKYQQGNKQEKFNRKEIDNYFKQHQDFDNKINYDSRNTFDMVDKIAQKRTNNTEVINKDGLTISEVYDNLTCDQIQKIKNNNKIIEMEYDNISQKQFQSNRYDTQGDIFSNYNDRYVKDNASNFTDIEASNEDFLESKVF